MKNKNDSKFLKFLYRLFESRDPHDPLSLAVDILYIVIILTSITFTILELTSVWREHELVFKVFEYIMIGFFFIEWICCYMIVDLEYAELPYFKRKLKWILSIESIVDIICLTIFIITSLLETKYKGVVYLDFICLIKVVRLYKLFKYKQYIPHKRKEVETCLEKNTED